MDNLRYYFSVMPGALLLVGYSAPVLFGFFCAYWAQQTRRNPWLWFFMGTLFSPLAGLALLAFNGEKARSEPRGEDLGHLLSVRKDIA